MPSPETNPSQPAVGPIVGEEDIARRAYEIYLSRGATDGADLDDWLRAERELRAARSKAK